MNPTVSALAAIGAIGAGCVAYGTFVERRWYRLQHVTVAGVLRGAPSRPLRVLHLSDLHLDPPEPALAAFLAEVAREPFDVLALTGDLLGWTGAEDACVELIADVLRGGQPAVAVLGSNDVYGPTPKNPAKYFTDPDHRQHGELLDTDRLIAGLQRIGVEVLQGDTCRLDTPAGPVAVGGLDDPHLADTLLPEPSAVAVDTDDAVLHLGLCHAPYAAALDVLVEAGHDLLLCGHTHGGQVRLPGVGALVTNSDLPRDQARGLSRWRDAWLHVSVGLGTSRYAPFRFACRPEATILTLTA